MYPTQHDITDANIAWAIDTLKGMLSAGNQVLIVSKPKGSLIWTLVEALAEWKDQILFRFTIGAMDDTILRFWEPGAPDFNNRFASLQIAHSNGFATSVSMEPMLETELDDIQDLVDTLNPYVTDSIWLGKANKLIERLGENGFTDEIHAIWAHRLMESQTDERILELYDRMKDYDKIKWKESIKAVVGIEAPAEIGMDV